MIFFTTNRHNEESINKILEQLIFLDKDLEVVECILHYGMDFNLVQKKNVQKFYSKLVRKLIGNNRGKDAIKILKFCIAKEISGLDDRLANFINKSNLEKNDKYVILISSCFVFLIFLIFCFLGNY